ncbi:MAG: hypothetical protein IJW82_05570 [Clostridia bacterium]|nr:hypothetical protein [Clostridia bacterium]
MELNRETAMRLWNKTFGKEVSTHDFTGRKIVKGAYNDRNSEFGWNVDHIYPQSKGGATNDSNLVVCHVLTNDEKSNKFPCFIANKKKFEILKVQNHYEIRNLSNSTDNLQKDDVNFLDSASGIRLFKNLKGIQNKPRFVGSVFIKLEDIANTAIIDFIEKLFDKENISFSVKKNYNSTLTTILLKNYDMPLNVDINNLLDKCVILNTYLGSYFKEKELISNYEIIFGVDHFEEKVSMYINDQNINTEILNPKVFYMNRSNCSNTLIVNNLVVINSEAKEKVECNSSEYYEYNYIYTNLKENLIKEVSKR